MNDVQIARDATLKAGVDRDRDKFTIDDVVTDMRVEREHGVWGTAEGLPASVDVVGDDTRATADIALAHLLEMRDGEHQYDYYDALEIVESAPAGYFRGRADNYWQYSRIVFIVVIVIMMIALFAMSENFFARVVVVMGCVCILVLKSDYRWYI
jgi:hypothetical protein